MRTISQLGVWYKDQKVGKLARTKTGLVAFQYDPLWLENGFSISSVSLPLKPELFIPKKFEVFQGLFGVFADSLPDGWGALVTDRMLMGKNLQPSEVDALDRLAIVGASGKGALEYRPELFQESEKEPLILEELARESLALFEDQKTEQADALYQYGGSSGGARPKSNIEIDRESLIVKFPCSIDPGNIASMEFDYLEAAKECGMDVPDHQLLQGKYFAVKRFDRTNEGKIHMVSVSALLETSHRWPVLDYATLMKLTMILTNSKEEAWKMFDLMGFNVFARNQDDHSNNFSFLYQDGNWHLAPAYDLTFCLNRFGEHFTTINGKGKNPGVDDFLAVAKVGNLDPDKAKERMYDIQKIVQQRLGKYFSKL